jgi:hypothetical protein
MGTSNPPPWNTFISDIEGIMFRVDVTAWGGTEEFILDSICLSPCQTDTVTLSVASYPCAGASVVATPLDIHGNGNGTTSFERDYIQGTIAYLEAPQTITCSNEQYCFKHWVVNGINFLPVTDNPVKVRMNASKTYTAVYCKLNKTIQVEAMAGLNPGTPLAGVPIIYTPTLGSNPYGLVINPYGTSPAPTPFIGIYHYPDCNVSPAVFSLIAPPVYNNHHFIRWQVVRTDCYGNSVSLIPTGSNSISYPLDNEYICTAMYDDCCHAVVTNSGANCCDGSIDFTPGCGSAPFTFAWNTNATTEDINGLCPGTYCVTVTDANGLDYECCWDVAQNKSACQSIALQNQTVANGRDTCFDAVQAINVAGNSTTFTVQSGGTARLIAGQKIVFMPGTRVIAGGYLKGWITQDGQFCTPSKLPEPAAHDGTGSADLMSQPGNAFFRVYPNPTSGNFTLELRNIDASAGVTVELYGIQGERILSEALHGELKYPLSLGNTPVGIYFIRVTSGKHTGTGKIIRQ